MQKFCNNILKTKNVIFVLLPILLGILFTPSFGCRCGRNQKNKYVIARAGSWGSLDLYGAEKSLNGLLEDIFQQIAQEEGITIQVVGSEDQSIEQMFEKHHYDAVLTALPPTPMTMRKYDFSDAIFTSGPVVVVNSNSVYKTVADLSNAEIGIDRNIFYSISDMPNPSWILRPYDSVFTALELVASDKIDGVVLNFILASRLSRGLYAGKVRILLPPLVMYSVRAVTQKGSNPELVELINSGVAKLKSTGLLKKMLVYWGLDNALPEST